ncbi:response regulator [Streptomyces sp. NPDC050355]|uniref:response regulator n=1 Tax=Streptomyces sp. NPDC050355 TaxID=3365609 RepID=UPI00378872F2
MIRVLLADDQALVRGVLAAVLRLEPDIDVAAEIGTGTEVLAAAQRTSPDNALLDVQMPGRGRLTVAADLQRALPGCRTIICTTFSRPGYLSRAMAAPAAGYVVKDSLPEQLVDAIRRVHTGLRFVHPALAEALDEVLLGLGHGVIRIQRKQYAAYQRLRNFACVLAPQQTKLLVYLKADPKEVDLIPGFTRDMTGLGHHGTGDLEVQLRTERDLERAQDLFRLSYAAA